MGDQRNGLKWVHSHISKFNGDNENITLGGASAGARSVMNHMTHSDSFGYFKNALTIGPPAIPYWKKSEVETIFGRIEGAIAQGNAQLGGCAGQYGWKTCLQMLPVADFAGLAGLVGPLYSQFAVENQKITQAESSWYPVIDGVMITNEPLQKFISGEVKQDLGFYYHEDSHDEGNSMMRNLFGIPAMRQAVFGEAAAQIWQDFNQHVVVPKAAFEGFLNQFYGPMGLAETMLTQTELVCPSSMPGHPGNALANPK